MIKSVTEPINNSDNFSINWYSVPFASKSQALSSCWCNLWCNLIRIVEQIIIMIKSKYLLHSINSQARSVLTWYFCKTLTAFLLCPEVSDAVWRAKCLLAHFVKKLPISYFAIYFENVTWLRTETIKKGHDSLYSMLILCKAFLNYNVEYF